MKKLAILLFFVSTYVGAQTKPTPHTWEIEVDPIAYLLKGYSGHIIYQPGRWRFDAGIFAAKEPEFFHGNKGFDVKTSGFGLKATYLIQGIQGLYTGIDASYGTTKAKYRETGASDTGHSWSIGPLVGYRFFLQKGKDGTPKGLYIAPWVAFSYNMNSDKIHFQDLKYQENSFGVFPTVHFGYRF